MHSSFTPNASRLHIALFGKRNSGKSSLINVLTGQDTALVSDTPGTTTDPVQKAMEIHGIGPCLFIDTPGFDDEGKLGNMRIERTWKAVEKTDIAILVIDGTSAPSPEDLDILSRIQKKGIPFLVVLNKADLAVLVVDAVEGISSWEEEMIRLFEKKEIPYLVVYNKMDLLTGKSEQEPVVEHTAYVSARTREGIQQLKEKMARLTSQETDEKRLAADLVKPFDTVILVVPIDKAAPKGRLILPQQQVIRDLLDIGAMPFVCRESELSETFAKLKEAPALVITDSQVFPLVDRLTPPQVRLTSFSILFARYKGDLKQAAEGAKALEMIQDGDPILISEGCTHHRQCGDIGTEKLPDWIRQYTGKAPEFHFTSGTEFPEDVSGYKLIVHCGGCMLNAREMKSRLRSAADQEIPMTNYGILIAYMKGILKRSMGALEPVR